MITNQETIKILNSWKDAVLDSKTKEAFEKAIKSVEIYEKYDWIFREIADPEWNVKLDAVGEALGIRLFYWQKCYIAHGCMRQTGLTTAVIRRHDIGYGMGKGIDGFKRKGEIGMMNKNFSDYNFKSTKLLSAWIDRDSDNNSRYLRLTYECIDKNGNEYMVVIPKICLPFINTNAFPWICENRNYDSETSDDMYIQLADDKLEILTSSGTVYDYNGKAVKYSDAKIIVIPEKDTTPKKMTLSEIEEELGYKIKLVEEKQCCETCKFQSILFVKEPCNKCRKYDKWESK